MAELLLIDDDRELCALLEEYLRGEGYEIRLRHDGDSGLAEVLSREPDLVVLDVMLPGLGGLDVLRRIRERSALPVVMLTARGEDVDRIVGLELGADDYLPKPFNPRELAARVRAVLRRVEGAGPGPAPESLVVDDLELDRGARVARAGEREVPLTGIEFSLLERLLQAAGSVVSRETLSRDVLGRRASSFDRSLDVHLSNIRKKLGPSGDGGARIKTVRGVGYQYLRRSGGGDDGP